MSIHRKLTTVCCAAVLALGLAACSSSDKETTADSTGGTGGTPPVGALALFATAQDSKDAAADATKAATDAVTAAMKAADELTALAVKGDSMTAVANAQAVLDAKTAAGQAVTDAEAALMEAKGALTMAMEDFADNTSLIAALEEAIEDAETAVEEATEARDGKPLKMAVGMVTGDDEDMPMSADAQGKAVAEDVGGAIGHLPGATNGSRDATKAPHTSPDDRTAIPMEAVKMSDQSGHNWAQIVGEDNVSSMPIGDGNTAKMVASIAGMTATDVHPTDLSATDGVSNGDTYAEGDETPGALYEGIMGMVYCLGMDCKVTTDGKLAGSWYFTPMDPDAYYRKVGTADVYTEERAYAEFGYWLSTIADGDENAGDIVVNTYARTGLTGTPSWTVNETTLTDTTATYSGKAEDGGGAVGMSLYKTFNEDRTVDGIYSGEFTADVSLTATFDDGTPLLGGRVSNFQGNAVDTTWSVTLQQTAVINAAVADGTTVATGLTGEWSATSYGIAEERPTGIFGGFNAHFSNGHAAGAYATRKD